MNTQYTIHNYISSLDYGFLSTFLMSLAILLLIALVIRKSSRLKISELINRKQLRDEIISLVLSSVINIEKVNSELIKQKELLECFSDDTIEIGIKEIKKIMTRLNSLDVLDDRVLADKTTFYFTGLNNMLSALYSLEKDSYKFQKEYQQKVVYYNRNYENYKNSEKNPELVVAYKKAVMSELDDMKNRILSELSTINAKRNEFLKEIELSQKLAGELKKYVISYKQRQVDTRKFYIKYLSFA